MDLLRQTNTLTKKTLRIILLRHFTSTIYSAFVLPVIASLYLGLGQKFNNPNNKFGIGTPQDIFSLGDALAKAQGGRDTVAFVNTGHSGGEIDRVIVSLSKTVTDAGKNATKISNEDDLGYVCKSTIRGTSNCYGAVVFYSSPNEGSGGIWNYTLRADAGLGLYFRNDHDDNDPEVYTLPLQHAVDAAIAGDSFPSRVQQYPYTQQTEEEREAQVLREYQKTFINYLSVAFVIALIGVCYHMPGVIATERETGISQLIDAMMPATRGWHRQFVRLVSHQNAFIMTYLPGWIIASLVCRALIWKNTSVGIMIIFFILSGFAITSMSLLGACLWRKAQMSGVVTAVVWIALGIVAQAVPNPGTATVAILGLLFTPCNFVYFITYIARYEQDGQGANLAKAHKDSPWKLPGIILWVFLILQFLAYPFIAAFLERTLHGVTTGVRSASSPEKATAQNGDVIRVENMTKIYRPGLLRRFFSFVSPPRPKVVAVDNLTLTAKRGQILALLGANGSGKSTTLDIIAGISNFTTGNVSIDARGGLGIAPQKNVLWDDLTVEEHIKIFNQLKSPHKYASNEETAALIKAIGLAPKTKAMSKTLSGGQKRKLQLGMMLTGGSAVCCVDEVSSGIDPLSRRKIWDILLSERGNRTIVMTTHFLDEADLLADNIAILSKGKLRAEGSSAQLKDSFGAGYRVHVLNARHMKHAPEVPGVQRKELSNTITYVAPSSRLAAEVIRTLEQARIPYQFSGPTIEDVFLNLADEVRENEELNKKHEEARQLPTKERSSDSEDAVKHAGATHQGLLPGRPINWASQILVFLRKRLTVLKTNWVPYAIAFLVPIVAAAITQMLVKGKGPVGCSPRDSGSRADFDDLTKFYKSASLVGGPSSKFNASVAKDLTKSIVPGSVDVGNFSFKLVDSLSEMQSYIESNRLKVSPGGWWLGDSGSVPTIAWRADNFSMYTSFLTQNLMNTMLANLTIGARYTHFDSPIAPGTLDALQLVIYFCIGCSIFPGLFGLYPNYEKRQQIRGLQYSSGARTIPVWAAHLLFDFAIILVSMALVTIIFATTSDIWYHPGYLFPVFMLYGMVAILWSYFFSLVCKSALATYAATAVLQGLGFAVYMISFLFILTFSSAASLDKSILISHWVIAIIFPTGSLIRAFFIALNTFSTTCDGDKLQSYPGAMVAYGGPILYLAVQAILLFGLVLWLEVGTGKYATGHAKTTVEVDDPEIANELVRVDNAGQDAEGLRVSHLTKAFKKNTVVDNVTFGIDHGEVFALLGPNGAGKSTTISLIRGDLHPSRNGGDVFVEKASVIKNRALARQNLGVCPQFDAIDSMTVEEHLQHYARIRGISNVDEQVDAVIRAVGLGVYTKVMAHTLSGGNKRKLSLAIALTGNPSVILLDEPSSGLDAAAKRVMWRTLETIVPGRSILLTTHSMEEADALANRAGIMAKRMLALGNTDTLRHRFGDTLHVHLVSKTAPHSTPEEMDYIRGWIAQTFSNAEIEQETYHGQMRYSIPCSVMPHVKSSEKGGSSTPGSAIGQLLVMLEENKEALGIAHYSVTPTTLNEVFLNIVGQHDILEEGYKEEKKPWYKKRISDWF
ncbi:ABC transporter [Pochonia chlamydosporia 170]|uniref:ABC transporter n=1 Tax=Pochonia chlamydosporia 170 TaxID=1380566 RepID=A0A179FKG0_METCM|nr:ABC transporter [Pochonia chlamydosporia 170]OAQ66044.2 ABC transporter [Pochonia chlamydosporia 170]